MEKIKSKIIVVLGPTASGKSDLGIKLARKFGGEIISADSRQVYREMDIGTGKVTKKEQRLAKHHLLDVASPKKVFTVSDFQKLGRRAVDDIISRHKLPIVVGGTGFYIDALLSGLSLPEVPPNKKLRAELAKQSAEQLFKQLKKLDPVRAKKIDAKNKIRLIRALEIIKTTGNPVPSLKLQDSRFEILWLGLTPKNLNKRIEKRLDARLKQGMIKEVKNLIANGVSKKRLHDLGLEYRWVANYLDKKISYQEMRDGLLRDIIKYSKRQMTWFKRNKEIHWVNPPAGGLKQAEKFILKFLAAPF